MSSNTGPVPGDVFDVKKVRKFIELMNEHDLAEIESFASHIGFLDHGRLQFSQSLVDLSHRFREVEVTLRGDATVPAAWPSEWLRPEAAASVIRFVDSRFDSERTAEQIKHLFGADVRIAAQAMSLRSIFVALARESKKHTA